MDPRLKSSTQWSPFPNDLCEQITETLTERFSEEYAEENEVFIAYGRIYAEEVLFLVGLSTPGQLKQPNFLLSFEYDKEKQDALERIQSSMDAIEHLFFEFFEEDRHDKELPRVWETITLEKKVYFFQYSTVNTNLEEEADKLLQEYDKKLVYGEPSATEEVDQDTTVH